MNSKIMLTTRCNRNVKTTRAMQQNRSATSAQHVHDLAFASVNQPGTSSGVLGC